MRQFRTMKLICNFSFFSQSTSKNDAEIFLKMGNGPILTIHFSIIQFISIFNIKFISNFKFMHYPILVVLVVPTILFLSNLLLISKLFIEFTSVPFLSPSILSLLNICWTHNWLLFKQQICRFKLSWASNCLIVFCHTFFNYLWPCLLRWPLCGLRPVK